MQWRGQQCRVGLLDGSLGRIKGSVLCMSEDLKAPIAMPGQKTGDHDDGENENEEAGDDG
jgi:hypothetical protein